MTWIFAPYKHKDVRINLCPFYRVKTNDTLAFQESLFESKRKFKIQLRKLSKDIDKKKMQTAFGVIFVHGGDTYAFIKCHMK